MATKLQPRKSKLISNTNDDFQEDLLYPVKITDFKESPSGYNPEIEENGSDSGTSFLLPSEEPDSIDVPKKTKTVKTRKRKGDPSFWGKNKRKLLRNRGQEYILVSHRIVSQRRIKDVG